MTRGLAAFAVLAVTACGRLDFDQLSDGGAQTEQDGTVGDGKQVDGAATGSTIQLVQKATNNTITIPLVVAIAPSGTGNVIVVSAQTDAGFAIASVTDNGGNSYVSAGAAASDVNSGVVDIWYAKASKPGATSITITSTTGKSDAHVYELSGADLNTPLDAFGAQSSVAQSLSPTGVPITTTVPGEMIITNADVENTVTGLQATDGFVDDNIAGDNDGHAHLIAAMPGTYHAVWNQNLSGTYATDAVSFKPAP